MLCRFWQSQNQAKLYLKSWEYLLSFFSMVGWGGSAKVQGDRKALPLKAVSWV